jgi:hypothetical protein
VIKKLIYKRKDTQQVKTKYKITDTKATPFGGLYVISELLSQISFDQLFDEHFAKLRKIRHHRPSKNISLLMGMIIAGGEKLSDIEHFSGDQTVCELFDLPSIPADTSLRDDMQRIGQNDNGRNNLLLQLNETLFAKLATRSITVDIDGTALPVDGHQENAEKGYCPVEQGSRCFQSVKAVCDTTETVIAEKTMSGDSHCAQDIINFIKPWLSVVAKKLDQIKLRLDAGFYSDTLMRFLEAFGNVSYEISVPQHQWLQDKVRRLCYRSYYHSHRQYASWAYGEGADGAFRYYVVERSLKEKGSQLDLFDADQYNYRVVVSNRQKQPQVLFTSYNKRARVEKHIEELKNQYGLGKLVSGCFDVTKALCWMSHLTFTVIGMLRQIAFRRKMKRFRLKRLRFLLFTTIGWFVEHSRKRFFKIGMSRIGPFQFNSLMQRIWAW